MANFTNNTTQLQSLLAKVNALPEAGGSSDEYLDDINAINGGTPATTMESAVDNTETYVGSQAELISQIVTALNGKAAGSNEDVSDETTEYTEQLDELESVIDSLPDTDGGSNIETCTVTIDIKEDARSLPFCCFLTTIENGVAMTQFVSESSIIPNAIKNSYLFVFWPEGGFIDANYGDYGSGNIIQDFFLGVYSEDGTPMITTRRKLLNDNIVIEVY